VRLVEEVFTDHSPRPRIPPPSHRDHDHDGGVGRWCHARHIRTVPTEDAVRFAEENHLAFIETSALDASGVDQAFHKILTGRLRHGRLFCRTGAPGVHRERLSTIGGQ
jgi:hypothetical protein